MKTIYLKIPCILLAAAFCVNNGAVQSLGMMPYQESQGNPPARDQALEYKPQEVAWRTELLNCQVRRGGIKIDLIGSGLMPDASGEVKTKSKKGITEIDAKFKNLDNPDKLGAQFLTYVLWTVTSQNTPFKLGELELDGSRGRLEAKSIMQVLALFVTAEPYAEVSQPGDIIVLEQNTPHKIPEANTGIMVETMVLRDGYAPVGYEYGPLLAGLGQPPQFRQALNAQRIARVVQAEKYARKEYEQAEDIYRYLVSKVENKRPNKDALKIAVTVTKLYDLARAAAIEQQTRIRP